jgi:hypothetical protein
MPSEMMAHLTAATVLYSSTVLQGVLYGYSLLKHKYRDRYHTSTIDCSVVRATQATQLLSLHLHRTHKF